MNLHRLTHERAVYLINYNQEIGEFTWKFSQGKAKSGSIVGTVQNGYRKLTIDTEQIRAHRLAWFIVHGEWPEGQIDHINGDKLDNRISNLRDVPISINMQNRYATKTKQSGLPYGVCFKHGKYKASISVGTFDTAEEASDAYMRAKRLIHEGCTR